MPKPAPSRIDQMLLFARNFVKHPVMLGSVIPSSRFLINEVLGQVNWKRARVIVEYGPGVGTFTGEILRRMSPDASLVVLETNREFVDFLRRSIPDERLHVIHGSAADVREELQRLGFESADYIISGIPFSTMPDEVREAILRATRNALHPQGAFLVYQFSARVLPYLEQVFRAVHRSFEPLNILPAQLFYCIP
jgi:phospholipid N-methyltransferase